MADIFEHLKSKPYPGRGILLGKTPAGKPVIAYFIMGRSENSRNRVFMKTGDGIKTEAFDPSKMTDPSLIIYHPVRSLSGGLIVTNGDQTDTIRDFLAKGSDLFAALATREFEPDPPNYTPRISGFVKTDGSYTLSILKSAEGDPSCCERFFYGYDKPIAGKGHFISTYLGDGEAFPSFSGDPLAVEIGGEYAAALAEKLWSSLDEANRVSLYVSAGGQSVIINKYQREA